MQALLDVVATRPMFKAELEFAGALTAVVALTPAQLASDDLSVVLAAGPTLRQRRQLALTPRRNFSALGNIFPHFEFSPKKSRVRAILCDLCALYALLHGAPYACGGASNRSTYR